MAFDTYMIIDDAGLVKGEATADGLQPATGWFEVLSFSFGASNPMTIGTSSEGSGGGKASLSSFNVMKKSEQASAMLFQTCCNGKHFEKAKVVLRKSGGTQLIFLQYEFERVFVESIQWSGSGGGDDSPSESVSFAFAKVKTTYFKQDPKTGAVAKAPNGEASWDLTKATA